MSEVYFLYQSSQTLIQCQKNDLMKDICLKFANKINININDIYFIYNGSKINENNTFAQQANSEDNKRNKMSILVYKFNNLKPEKNKNKVKSNDIICSECGEICIFKIINYQISLSNCKNGHTKKLFFKEYEDTQYINEENIICVECKKVNKAESFNKKFFKCLSCNQNLCPLCQLKHDQNHCIADYSQRNYICEKHNEKYDSYCNICKKNLCLICSSKHDTKHNIIYFRDIISKIDYSQFDKLKINIDIMKNEIDFLIEKLNKVKEGIDIYYNISNNFINNNNIKNRNYQSLNNLNNITSASKDIHMDIQNIIKEKKDNNKFKRIMEIYDKMYKFDETKLIDKINPEDKKVKFEEKIVENNIVSFTGEPTNLKYKEDITNNIKGWGLLNNFDVYNGLKDNIEYIVYNNKINNNLEIMRINDKTIINSLKGHNTGTNVIKYYIKDNKEEYIVSCDKKNLVIVWDINNNYNKKYNIIVKDLGAIWDTLLLFNIFNKNYILISSWNKDEFSKLYEFKDNTPFIRNIYGTNENNTAFMILWLYEKQYYIIEICYCKISIHNMLKDECYATLTMNPEGKHCCGYIYNDNYLCVSDLDNNHIRIWDLVNKVIYKQINCDDKKGREIIPWNNKYAILGCDGGFVIINVEEGKMVKKIKLDNTYVEGVKKLKGSKIRECIMISISDNSDNSYKIKLYSL